MATRDRTHIVAAWIMAFFILALLLISRFIILDCFLTLEERDIGDNLLRARNDLKQHCISLSRSAGDYSGWDDAYQFIADGNRTFITKNLDPSLYPQLGINLLLFVDLSGKMVYGKAFDLEKGKEVPLPASLTDHLSSNSPLVNHSSEKAEVKGLLVLQEGALLMASRPIVTSNITGPVRGAVIMGRWLDETRTRQLAEIANIPLSFAPVPATAEKSSRDITITRSDESISAAAVIADIYGKPARELRVELPRTIYRQGKFTVLFLGLATVATVLVFGIICLVLARRLTSSRQQVESSRQRYEELVSMLPQTIFEADTAGRLTFANRHALECFGHTDVNVLSGLTVFDFIAPEDHDRARQNVAARLSGAIPHGTNNEYLAMRMDGSTFPAIIYSSPIIQDGKTVGIRGILVDISKRKSMEEQLRSSERRFADLVNFLPDPLFAIDRNNTVIAWNRAVEALTGIPSEQLLGKDGDELGIPFYGVRRKMMLHLAMEPDTSLESQYPQIRRRGDILETEIYIDKPGFQQEGIWLWAVVGPLYDSTGAVSGAAEVVRDITKRVQENEERQLKADRTFRFHRALAFLAQNPALAGGTFEAALHCITEASAHALQCETAGIWFYTEDSRAINCMDQYTTSTRSHTSGATIAIDSCPDYFASLASRQVIASHDVTKDQRVAELLDSYLRPLGITSMLDCPIMADAGMRGILCHEHKGPSRTWSLEEQGFVTAVAGFVATVIEAHQRQKAEQSLRQLNEELENRVAARTADLEEALRHQETFSYSISHDLRAPLRAVDGCSRIVMEEYAPLLPEDGRNLLTRMSRNVLRMGWLIDDLLSFSRLSRHALSRQEVNVRALVNSVVQELLAGQEERQIHLEIGELPDCQADPSLLRQVYVNLIDNALKYTGKKDAAEITIGSREQEGKTVYFVRDNGVGFDMAHSGKLFGVFQRLHGMEEFGGTGVGLAIAHSIVTRHGGTIWAEAREGEGATFFFTI
jgi:PAS domain S-box-containing protein